MYFKFEMKLKRLFDILFSITALFLLLVPLLILYFAVLITSSLPVIYWSERVGKNNKVLRCLNLEACET